MCGIIGGPTRITPHSRVETIKQQGTGGTAGPAPSSILGPACRLPPRAWRAATPYRGGPRFPASARAQPPRQHRTTEIDPDRDGRVVLSGGPPRAPAP
jgi:hypothetical protein